MPLRPQKRPANAKTSVEHLLDVLARLIANRWLREQSGGNGEGRRPGDSRGKTVEPLSGDSVILPPSD
jgi:hypothetical protein